MKTQVKNLLKANLVFVGLLSQALAVSNLTPRQWALKNDGISYSRKVGEYNNEIVQGIKGIDINQVKDLDKLESESSEVVVAVIDSGLDINHPELKDRIWENPDCVGLSDEGRAKLPCHGINILNNTADLSDVVGHGTFIAGQIAANYKDSIGSSGATHNKVKIMGIKALNDKFTSFQNEGKLTSELLANGVVFAAKNGAHVINLSLGFPKIVVTPKVKAAFDFALDKGVVIVAAAGNNNKDKPVFPCGHKRVICVGAIDAKGEKVLSSNFGHKVDLYAPGENIVSTIPMHLESDILRVNNYDLKTGTSYAAPFVTALAALVKSKNPELDLSQVQSRILNTTRDINGIKVVDFTNALTSNFTSFINPVVKEIDEISVNESHFKVEFELTSLVELDRENIKVNFNEKDLSLVDISLKRAGDSLLYRVKLNFNTLSNEINSNQAISITFNNKAEKLISSEVLKLGLELNTIAALDNIKMIKGIPAATITLTNAQQKRTSLQRVLHKDANKATQDLFFTASNDLKSIYLIKESDKSFSPLKLVLERDSVISAVMKVDINFDGKLDYFVYGASSDKKEYFISFFDENANPLFEKNYWSIKASRFGGLSFSKGFENFSYLRMSTTFGVLNLPVFEREWTVPFEDNGLDPIDRLQNTLKKRVYYFEPVIGNEKVELNIRTLNSLQNIESLRKKLKLKQYEELDLSEVIIQSVSEKNEGVTQVVAQFGTQSLKKSALLEFISPSQFSVIKIIGKNSFGNSFVRARDNQNTFSDNISFSTIFDRNFIRFSDFNQKTTKIDSGSWSDLLISTIDIFDNKVFDEKIFFVESRYNVISAVHTKDGSVVISKIPVDRESSYPGLAFSQSFQSTLTKDGGFGILTDTKSIYGNTIGVLKLVDNKLTRTLSATYALPENCASLGHTELSGKGYLMLHCNEAGKSWITNIEL